MDRDAALADLDAARAEWEAVFMRVPDAALPYLKPGDDYALGGLQVHVNWVLVHYGRVLDALKTDPHRTVQPLDKPEEPVEANKKAKVGLTGTERTQAMAEMAALHHAVKETVGGISAVDWSHKTPVMYREGQDPLPTSPDDVVGWLRGHYREHVEQCPQLVVSWEMS
ncbi:MAG TPA: hypothetical protein VLR46_08095 [Candidatus Dormibacteraeota bacterium]|nr:hypothetical protein [Candidatus Dormibacteraeota bacterium]